MLIHVNIAPKDVERTKLGAESHGKDEKCLKMAVEAQKMLKN